MTKKLNVKILIYMRQIISNAKPKASVDEIKIYHAEECKS